MVRVVVKISILLLLILAWTGLCRAAQQNANSNPCNMSESDAAGLNGNLSVDIHALNNFKDTSAGILKEEKFAELDCLADHARSGKERLPGGLWKIQLLYGGLRQPVPYPVHATQEDWTHLLERLQKWGKARPESITARVALALAYLDYAQDARGSGYSNTVSDTGWKLFEERTAEAKRILEEASTLPAKCPEWYVAMQMVSINQSWSVEDARALFEQAYKFEPEYYIYARDLASYLLPKWDGEPGDTEKFVQEIADRMGGDSGCGVKREMVEFFVEGIRSQLPKLEEYGIATREEVEIDTLADRIEAAGRAADPQWVSARYIAAWARKP